MSKRKTFDEIKFNDSKLKNPKKPRILFEECPVVNSIIDLINIGKTNKFYKNINSIMLWNIVSDLEELNNMIGMDSLKESIFYQIIYYLQNMHLNNKNQEYLHTMILGSPGTGKTTVAKIIGSIYKNMGILSNKGIFKVASREDLIGEYLGSTAIKTSKLLHSCLGGVLFIDEAYSLGSGKSNGDSFSKEAVDTLCGFLSEHKNDFCCIIAGYEKEIKNCFLSINPGLERRFPWVHKINEYTSKNLSQIFIKMIHDINWELNIKDEELVKFFDNNKDFFKNSGGDIETFISKIKLVHSKRVFGLDKSFKFKITLEDINNGFNLLKKFKLNNEQPKFYSYYT